MSPPHLVLVGMPGSGKSSVARHVARLTGRRCVDVDTQIERVEGRAIPEIFAAEGEAGFRDVETRVLREVLASDEALVVATGGGSVLRDENRAVMRERGTVIWLRARPETLRKHVGDGSSRPLLAGDPLANLQRLLDERRESYAAAAHDVIDVDGLSLDEIVGRVLATAGLESDGVRS